MRPHILLLTAAALAGSAVGAQAQTVIAQNETGTVSGASTVDTYGLFGPAGADLKGKPITIHLQYVPAYFGPSATCRTHACTYNTSSGTPNTPGAALISVTINGKQVTRTSAHFAAAYFDLMSTDAFILDVDANSGYGIGYLGAQLYTTFSAPVKFGAELAPANQPVKNNNQDYIQFLTPNSGDQPDEILNFVVTSASQ